MHQQDDIRKLEEQLTQLQGQVAELLHLVQKMAITNNPLGDWVNTRNAMLITDLSASSLYKLRASGKLSESSLSGKAVFYRISDLTRILNENEKK